MESDKRDSLLFKSEVSAADSIERNNEEDFGPGKRRNTSVNTKDMVSIIQEE
jgi:hypothetical protein